MPYRKEENWDHSSQRQDGQNNDYYIFPKGKQDFWKLAEKNGEIHLRFIGKYAQALPCYQHIITVGKNPHKSAVGVFIRTSTINNIDISKLFKDTIVLAAPKGAEEALAYRLSDFNQGNETIRVEKEIKRQKHLHRPFQEPLGPEPKLQIANLATHYVYPRDIRKKANAIRKANFLCGISNNHPLFKSRTTHQNYVEGHHLIPLKQWDNFLFSLDVEANIVVLCPHCHKMLHHGTKEDIRPLLDLLFQKRKQALADKGIQLTWEQLCSYYGANE
ncbi:MAG: HNH endonuclease [Elusimicrobia bacterium]|nr:HNH endonuclease [Elusimicrobiota bacterium]MDY6038969.1 HNH endonuclease [Elusimicrobiaceae bacterium]